jgi:glycosyltransferase involved in cell wall biosynthesis
MAETTAIARPLRVGLNLMYLLPNSGGAGTYAHELIRGILAVEPETEITAFVSREAPASLLDAPWASGVRFVRYPITISHGPPWNIALTMRSQWLSVARSALARQLDVVHGLANITPLAAPGVARVVTLLDLIWLTFPHTMERRATIGMKMVAPPSAHAANRVIAISEAARDDMARRIRLRRSKIDVTPLGIRQDPTVEPAPEGELRRKLGLDDAPIVLCVAQKREHKNLTGLLRAVAALEDKRTRLVIPGSPTPHEEELKALAAELGMLDRLVLPAWLERDELEGLYALASCFVLPSFEEGFGLPLLEAMRRGVPVATSSVSSMPEVAGDAAVLFDPHDPADIGHAIERIMHEPGLAEGLRRRGFERCAAFTWERTARLTLASYRRAIDGLA